MVSTEFFNKLKKIETSSWAIWGETGQNDLDFFLSNIDFLHANVVFVGLNRSNIVRKMKHVLPFSNFHMKNHVGDKRLKRIIQDGNLVPLIGGFMTDISGEIETDSNKIKIDDSIRPVNQLKEKLHLFESISVRHIICFGVRVFDTFTGGLNIDKTQISNKLDIKLRLCETKVRNETWMIYRVWHYSNYGKFQEKADTELPLQLNYISSLCR